MKAPYKTEGKSQKEAEAQREPSVKKKRIASKKTLPLRVVNGAGFDYEDCISASLMVKMLGGEPAPVIGGNMVQLQAQVGALKWNIDDLLLKAKQSDGRECHLALSVKGNRQVNSSGLPAGFVSAAWTQWTESGSPMRKDSDGLALAVFGRDETFEAAWREVKQASEDPDSTQALKRIKASRKQLKVFDSVRALAPGGVAEKDAESLKLVQRMDVLYFDFQSAQSESKSQAVRVCRSVLASGALEDAEALWDALVREAAKVRLGQGTTTLALLMQRVRSNFDLKDLPDYRADWVNLSRVSADWSDRVESTLPNRVKLERKELKAKIEGVLSQSTATVIRGDSGSGKSALVRDVLDERFASWRRVCLRPEELSQVVGSSLGRERGLRHRLENVLLYSPARENVLIIDAAERIDRSELPVVRNVIAGILQAAQEVQTAGWRVVVISQLQDGLSTANANAILQGTQPQMVDVEPISDEEVREVLASTTSLAWLGTYDETVSALRNLKTLSWLVEAHSSLSISPGSPLSHVDVADLIWTRWTDRSPSVQRFMMQLSVREASFQRSFALSELEQNEAEVFERRPKSLPLVQNVRTNRVEFAHDLAADWARFQYLKQYAEDISRWAEYASHPLWTSALRMLGQYLLREQRGEETLWDQTYEAAGASGLTHAQDILLDALYLDPMATQMLNARVAFLLERGGARLDRLLSRFLHVATTPDFRTEGANVKLSVYLEAQMRTLVHARWVPVVRFLANHAPQLGALEFKSLAKLIQTWLQSTPEALSNGSSFPYRRELAEIALEIANNVRFNKGRHRFYMAFDLELFTAALSAAPDLPDEVCALALELAGRRDMDSDVERRVQEARRQDALEMERRRQDRADPFDARMRATDGPPSLSLLSRKRLPPWPLGAKRKVDRDFRKACFGSHGLGALMRTRPLVAAEVLLALIVDDEPELDYAAYRDPSDNAGLQFPDDVYPRAFWKSPFFHFLTIAPQAAIDALVDLSNFATQQYAGGLYDGTADVAGIELETSRGVRLYTGNTLVYGWNQSNDMNLGDLACALDALEYWFVKRKLEDPDTPSFLASILERSNSAAMLGVLANVAKRSPRLLADVLWPLLTHPVMYAWDEQRLDSIGFSFDATGWIRYGEVAFESARDWAFSDYKKTNLRSVAIHAVKTDRILAARLKELGARWRLPSDEREQLEQELLVQQLNWENYPLGEGVEPGDPAQLFVCPKDLAQRLEMWNQTASSAGRYVLIASECRELLRKGKPLADASAVQACTLLQVVEEDSEVKEAERLRNKIALSSVLVVLAADWLAHQVAEKERVLAILSSFVEELVQSGGATEEFEFAKFGESHEFAAQAVVQLWAEQGEVGLQWDRSLLVLMTSSDRALRAVVEGAYARQATLGLAWWRLLQVCVLWSGLSLLSPDSWDEEGLQQHWQARRLRFLRLKLKGVEVGRADLRMDRVAKGVGRLTLARKQRSADADDLDLADAPHSSYFARLHTGVLKSAFQWLLEGAGTSNWDEDVALALSLWEHVVDRARAKAEDSAKEYDILGDRLGYDVLKKLAELSLQAPRGRSNEAWEPVLEHGPAAHYALSHFFSCFFLELKKSSDKLHAVHAWTGMIQWVLGADWAEKARWFRVERAIVQVLGMEHESLLEDLPAGTVLKMKSLYAQWAQGRLSNSDENMTAFCLLLASKFGAPLRAEGVLWVSHALSANPQMAKMRRDDLPSALTALASVVLHEDAPMLTTNAGARDALLSIAAVLASGNSPEALTLQERIRRL
ncbi:hypothetical protein [Hydrogenophaga sp.]|uniref:hypothetical protein n=1 Tax=Hydrogenophaga sp. TaxID=1904254 RepID=UPI00271DD6D2|nr:hypothetical protein [Hydrogenophaga sp.]MDO9437620.1 hypothetical protein [Hydrogenophaga sp.]